MHTRTHMNGCGTQPTPRAAAHHDLGVRSEGACRSVAELKTVGSVAEGRRLDDWLGHRTQ